MDPYKFVQIYIQQFDASLVVVFGLLITIFILKFISRIVRLYYTVTVNCWFCNSNTKVNFNNRNQFICPSCHQYNGFTDDGGYNCTIDAQHDVSKNMNTYQNFNKKSKDILNFDNSLCETCNIQQSLKVRALAEFSSIAEDSSEIEDFKNKLEDMYDLCQQCEATVHQILGKQNTILKPKLIAWRVLKSKNIKNLIFLKQNMFLAAKGCQMVLPITSLYMIISKLAICFMISPLSPIADFNPISDNWLIYSLKVDILVAMVGLVYSCTICVDNTYAKTKIPYNFLGWLLLVLLHNNINTGLVSDGSSYYLQLFVAMLNFLLSTHSTEKAAKKANSKSLIFTPKIRYTSPKMDACNSSDATTSKMLQDDEIGITLNNLKIGTPQKSSISQHSTGIFNTQYQFLPNRNCLSETSTQRGRSILQQPKFSSKITQSSWVAGGYWGESPKRKQPSRTNIPDLNKRNEEFDLFSHASSKSSGFVSQTSDPSGLYYAHYMDPANIPRRNLSSQFGSCDEKKSMDSLDACSVSSCYSTACSIERQQFHDWKSSQSSLFSAQGNPQALGNSSNHASETKVYFSWWYTCIAFALGFSISANIFLFFAFYKSDLIQK